MHSRYTLISLLGIAASCAANPQRCTTYYGRHKHGYVPTSTCTVYTTIKPTVIVTSTPSTTITPPPITSSSTETDTSTITSTTQSTDTLTTTTTFSTTSTVVDPTTTITETSTVSESSTTTTTSTTTVAATAGFAPIQTSVPGSSYSGNFGGPANKRGLQKFSPARNPFAFGKTADQCRRYPKKVDCTVTKTRHARPTTITKTAPTRTITGTTSTVTVTSTTTVTTTTTTVLQPASTTVTSSTTITETTTTTPSTTTTQTTTTTTTTTLAATATSFAQCNSANNYADTLNGQYGVQINDVTGNNNFAVVSGPTDATSCCNICAGDPTCGVSAWSQQNGNQCYISQGCSIMWQMFNQDNNFIFNNGCNKVTPQ